MQLHICCACKYKKNRNQHKVNLQIPFVLAELSGNVYITLPPMKGHERTLRI